MPQFRIGSRSQAWVGAVGEVTRKKTPCVIVCHVGFCKMGRGRKHFGQIIDDCPTFFFRQS